MKNLLTICLVMATAVSGCKKEREGVIPAPTTTTQKLSNNRWREVGHSVRSAPSSAPTSVGGNIYDLSLPCQRDNFLMFHSDNTFTVDEGQTLCAQNDPQQKKGSWSFRAGTNELGIDIAIPNSFRPRGQSGMYVITELTETTLGLRCVEQTIQGQTVEEFTYFSF